MRGDGHEVFKKNFTPTRFKFTVKEIRRRIKAFRDAHPEIDWNLDRRHKPPIDD